MKTPSASLPCTTRTVTFDPADREQLARLNFIQAAEAACEHYRETGLHLTLDEMSAWADAVRRDPKAALPECHGVA